MERGLVFGLNIGDLLEIYDPDSQSWKMSGCLFTGDYAKSSGALPKSGMMQNGKIYGQATWVRRTDGNESGLWHTPRVFLAIANISMNDTTHKRYRKNDLIEVAKRQTWPTPSATDYKGSVMGETKKRE